MIRQVVALPAALFLAACGGNVAVGALPTHDDHDAATPAEGADATAFDATTMDASADIPEADSGSESAPDTSPADVLDDMGPADAVSDAGPDEGGPYEDDAGAGARCDADAGCYVIPDGWSLVAYSTVQTACPEGFASAPPTNFSGSAEPTTACTCGGCTMNYVPTCNAFGVVGFYGAEDPGPSACGTAYPPGDFYNNNPGTCQTNLPQGDYAGRALEYLPAPPEGSCGAAGPGVLTSPVTFPWQGEVCSPDSAVSAGCIGNVCTVGLPPPFRVCVSNSPFRECPANSVFTEPYLEAAGPSASCSTCNCAVTATCSGTVQLFSDTACMGSEFDVPADGQCHSSPPGIGPIASYRYTATAPTNVSCVPDVTTATVMTSWQKTVTVCCAP